MEELLSQASLFDFKSDAYRNIVSLRVSESLFDDLSDEPEDHALAQEIEYRSKPPSYRDGATIINRPYDEADYNNAIKYPFYNWSDNRFSDGTYGVWYGSAELETTIHETAYHWRNGLLKDANWQDLEGIVIERRVHLVHCHAAIIDIRPLCNEHSYLVGDSYHDTQALGRRIHHEGHPGLFTKSARCGGDNIAIFRERVLVDPRPLCYLTYTTHSSGIQIERKPGQIILDINN